MRMLALSVCISLVALSGCDRRDAVENQPTPQPAAGAVDTGTPAPAPQSADTTPIAGDSQALGLLGTVNEHEIAAARQATAKEVSGAVLDFAKMMDEQHSENQAKTIALGTLASTPEVRAMADKGKAELAELETKFGKDYESAYVDAMVKGHAEALSLIDSKLIPLAATDAVKKHLSDTRAHVAMHLEAAKKLQSK